MTVAPGPRAKPAIFAATLDMLDDVGYTDLTIEGVAARAGVAKTTIYRWWATKGALVGEAVGQQLSMGEVVDTGNIRADLIELYHVTLKNYSGSFAAEVLPILAATQARDTDLIDAFRAKFLRPRRSLVEEAFARAVSRGEVPPDVDQALIQDMLAGAIFYRTVISGETFTDTIVERMVDAVLRGDIPRLPAERPKTSRRRRPSSETNPR